VKPIFNESFKVTKVTEGPITATKNYVTNSRRAHPTIAAGARRSCCFNILMPRRNDFPQGFAQ